MTGSAGGSLAACASSGGGSGSAGSGDYPQNWYDQGIVVDPNNADRVFFDTFDIWLASRTGTAWYDVTCGYNGTSVANHVVHVDQHALAFVHGSSDILLAGNDGGVHVHHSTPAPRSLTPPAPRGRISMAASMVSSSTPATSAATSPPRRTPPPSAALRTTDQAR
jgi:hypothetical protein